MTVSELMEILKESEPDESVYIGFRGDMYPADRVSFPIGWDGLPQNGTVIVSDWDN